MNTNFFKIVFILIVFLLANHTHAQVESVKYQIRYNKSTCLFDCCLIIHQGQARTPQQRAQFSAQYTIVVPTGSIVDVAANKNPIQNNQSYKGILPLIWFVGSSVQNPEALEGSDLYAFTPTLSPTSFYNNLNAGDTLVLFSLRINTIKDCASGIRLFENGVDPESSANGLGGGDYSQGFTMGNTDQKYLSNENTIYPPLPDISALYTSCQSGLEIQMEAQTNNCQSPLKYKWEGPDSYTSTGQDVLITNASPYKSGLYSVIVSDKFGCSKSLSINAVAKPDAGTDQFVKCYATGAASLSAKGSGRWTIGSASAGTADIQNRDKNKTTVYNFSNPGTYYLLWSSDECHDTVVINTGVNCSCAISANYVLMPDQYNYCVTSAKDTIKGTEINNTVGLYKWVYQFNSQPIVTASGISNTKNYILPTLNQGRHRWQRIFQKTSQPTCSDTSNIVEINVLPNPDAGISDTLFCTETDTAFLQANTDGFWSLGQGSDGTATLASIGEKTSKAFGFSSSGNYYFIRSNEVCTDTVIITLLDWCGCDKADAGDSLRMCTGDTYELTGNCVVGIWKSLTNNPNGAVLDATVNGNAMVHFSNMAEGEHKFVYSVLGKYSDTVSIRIFEKPTVNIGEDFGYCNDGSSFIISASGGKSFFWSTGDTTNSIIIHPDTTTEYVVTGMNEFGCTDTDTINIQIYEKPEGEVPPITPVFEADPLTLAAGEWKHALEYRWIGPNNFTSTSPVHVIAKATKQNEGMYYLTVMSPDECYSYSQVEVRVMERLLPVRLTDYRGSYHPEKKSNDIQWTTSMEINSDYYVIERSDNGTDFIEIGKVKSAGNSAEIITYPFIDEKINIGVRYFYRLLQVDHDGKVSDEGIISIQTGSNDFNLATLYPNPATENLALIFSGTSDEIFTLEVFNSSGKPVWSKKINGYSANENIMKDFDPQQYMDGVYYIYISSVQKTEKLRFVIIR